MIKLFLIFLLSPSITLADFTVEYNLLTAHTWGSCSMGKRYENRVADCGKIINNKLIGISQTSADDFKGRFFIGENSVGTLMVGGTFSYIGNEEGFDLGPVFGLYFQDTSMFNERKIDVFGDLNGSIGIMPVMGLELQYKVDRYKVFSIATPAVINIGVGLDF